MNCSNCGVELTPSGGQTGWTFKDRKGVFCARCAGTILYPLPYHFLSSFTNEEVRLEE